MNKVFIKKIGLSSKMQKDFAKDLINRKSVCKLPDKYAEYSKSRYAFNIHGLQPKTQFYKEFMIPKVEELCFEVHTRYNGTINEIYFIY
jgi:uncharacterized protein YktB (UPF0637 family)